MDDFVANSGGRLYDKIPALSAARAGGRHRERRQADQEGEIEKAPGGSQHPRAATGGGAGSGAVAIIARQQTRTIDRICDVLTAPNQTLCRGARSVRVSIEAASRRLHQHASAH